MDTLIVCSSCLKLNRVPFAQSEVKQPVCGVCKKDLPLHLGSSGVAELNDKTMPVLIQKSSRPVVIDFWAPWCGPCRSFAPTFQQAAKEFAGQLVLAKINTEDFPQMGTLYQVRGIPTLIVFKDGREVTRQSGAMPLEVLKNFLRPLV